MTKIDVSVLIEWLGPEGSVAGLDKSNITNAELMVVARENGLTVEKKTARRQIAIEIVMSNLKRIDKEPDYLLLMSKDELQRYFSDRMVSTKEIVALLSDLGIPPTGKTRAKMSEFAANEISDLGMFQRVAKGNSDRNKPSGRE